MPVSEMTADAETVYEQMRLSASSLASLTRSRQVHESSYRGNSLVCGCSEIKHSAKILQRARISGNAKIMNRAVIKGYAEIGGNSVVTGFARVSDHARVGGAAAVKGCAFVKNNAVVKDLCIVSGDAVVMGEYVLDGCKRVNKGVLCGSGNPVAV